MSKKKEIIEKVISEAPSPEKQITKKIKTEKSLENKGKKNKENKDKEKIKQLSSQLKLTEKQLKEKDKLLKDKDKKIKKINEDLEEKQHLIDEKSNKIAEYCEDSIKQNNRIEILSKDIELANINLRNIEEELIKFKKRCENLQQSKADLNSRIEELEKQESVALADSEKAENDLRIIELENVLKSINSKLYGQICRTITILENNLSLLYCKKTLNKGAITKNDILNIMNLVADLRDELRDVDLGSGYNISLEPVVECGRWLKQFGDDKKTKSGIEYDNSKHKGVELKTLNKMPLVAPRTMGFRYTDMVGEEQVDKAEVYSVDEL